MKKILIIALALITLSFGTAIAGDGDAEEAIGSTAMFTFSPIVCPILTVKEISEKISKSKGDVFNGDDFNREQLKAVRDDSLDFLGGEVITEKLEQTIKSLREIDPKLEEATDEEIASLIITLAVAE